MIIDPNNDPTRGGIPLQKVPLIPWDAFVHCGLKVYWDGEIQLAVFDPQPMESAEEAFQTLRLLMAAQSQKPGPIAWETVPEVVQKHFRFLQEEGNGG